MPDLKHALNQIASVASDINEAVRAAENRIQIMKIDKTLVGGESLVAAHRLLVKEGFLRKVCRKNRQKRKFFLFNDLLVYAKPVPATQTVGKVVKQVEKYFVSFRMHVDQVLFESVPDFGPNQFAFLVRTSKKVSMASRARRGGAWAT